MILCKFEMISVDRHQYLFSNQIGSFVFEISMPLEIKSRWERNDKISFNAKDEELSFKPF